MRQMCRLLGLLVVAPALLPTALAAEEVRVDNPWDREMAAGLAADQQQVKEGVIGASAIGQVFTPAMPTLERVDVVLKNRQDQTPGRIRLLRWMGSYAETAKQAPLWEDDADFSGVDEPRLVHYFPRVAVEPGKPYLLEVLRPSESFYVGGVQEDAYPAGFVVAHGGERRGWDLWFRTFGKAAAPAGEPAPRPLPPLTDVRPQPPREAAPVSRETYLAAVRTYAAGRAAKWAQEGRGVAEALFYTGFLYRYGGEKQLPAQVTDWLRLGGEYIRQEGAGDSPWFASEMGLGIRWLRGSPEWSAEREAAAREILLGAARRMWKHPERGAMNRAMWDVLIFRLASDLYPDVPEAGDWRQFSEREWRAFAELDDTEEDSAHYNAVFIFFMLSYVHVTGQDAIFERPGMRQWAARYRDVLAPNGMMVGWGDSLGIGADWGAWAALFETAAKVTRDGTFKDAARRTVQAHLRCLVDDNPLQRFYEDMPSLVWAYVGSDDSVAPVAPEWKSGVLTCAAPRLRPKTEREAGWYELERRQTPWKLVLRSSPAESQLYSLFGLLPFAGHGHPDAPALLALAANGTLLLHDSTYFDRHWSDHNLLYGVRVSGGKLGASPGETSVREFGDGKAAAYAEIAWQDPVGWGTGFVRQVLFVKGLGWVIHDRTEAKQPAEWYLGPMWQVDRLRERGTNWFDTDYPAPSSFAWPMANGTDHLLVWFAPRAGAAVDYADMSRRVRQGKPWYSSAPWCIYQCAGPLALSAEKPAWFTSVLLPLSAGERAGQAAQGVQVKSDAPGATVLEVQRGTARWTLALINDGKARPAGRLSVDAKAAVVRESPEGLAAEAFGARKVLSGAKTLMESPEPRTWVLDGGAPAR